MAGSGPSSSPEGRRPHKAVVRGSNPRGPTKSYILLAISTPFSLSLGARYGYGFNMSNLYFHLLITTLQIPADCPNIQRLCDRLEHVYFASKDALIAAGDPYVISFPNVLACPRAPLTV